MAQFGKRTQLTRQHFADFETAFGHDPLGSPASLARRTDSGETGRFRCFTRQWIAERGDSLDISWLKDESETNAEELVPQDPNDEPAARLLERIWERTR